MDTRQLLIQTIGFAGTVLFFFSYQCRENRRLFQVQLASYLLYTVHLLLLGAVTGGISYILNTLRSFCLGSRYEVLKGKAACGLICLLQLTALYFTWDSWHSLLPVAANIAATVGGYTRDGRKIRLVGMLINSPLWMIYNLLVGSWAGILDEIVSEASMLLSICRYGWKNLEGAK